jgi:hypothetical protein
MSRSILALSPVLKADHCRRAADLDNIIVGPAAF